MSISSFANASAPSGVSKCISLFSSTTSPSGALVHDRPAHRAAVDGEHAELPGVEIPGAAAGDDDVAAEVGVIASHPTHSHGDLR